MVMPRPITSAQFLPHLARLPGVLATNHPELRDIPVTTANLFPFLGDDTAAYRDEVVAPFLDKAIDHGFARQGAFQAEFIATSGVILLSYWPQEDKVKESGQFKDVKTNCFEATVYPDGRIETAHLVSVSKDSPCYVNHIYQQPRFVDEICPAADGWYSKRKVHKKGELVGDVLQDRCDDVLVARWAGKPVLDHIELAQAHLLQFFDDIVLPAQAVVFHRYDLKGPNVAVRENADGSYTFEQIDRATAACTPARFPYCEARRDVLSRNRLLLRNWFVQVRHQLETSDTHATFYFTSNLIYLIFEIFDWSYARTIEALRAIIAHIDAHPDRYNAEFVRYFKMKAHSFEVNRDAQWPPSDPTQAQRQEIKRRKAEEKERKKQEERRRRTAVAAAAAVPAIEALDPVAGAPEPDDPPLSPEPVAAVSERDTPLTAPRESSSGEEFPPAPRLRTAEDHMLLSKFKELERDDPPAAAVSAAALTTAGARVSVDELSGFVFVSSEEIEALMAEQRARAIAHTAVDRKKVTWWDYVPVAATTMTAAAPKSWWRR